MLLLMIVANKFLVTWLLSSACGLLGEIVFNVTADLSCGLSFQPAIVILCTLRFKKNETQNCFRYCFSGVFYRLLYWAFGVCFVWVITMGAFMIVDQTLPVPHTRSRWLSVQVYEIAQTFPGQTFLNEAVHLGHVLRTKMMIFNACCVLLIVFKYHDQPAAFWKDKHKENSIAS